MGILTTAGLLVLLVRITSELVPYDNTNKCMLDFMCLDPDAALKMMMMTHPAVSLIGGAATLGGRSRLPYLTTAALRHATPLTAVPGLQYAT